METLIGIGVSAGAAVLLSLTFFVAKLQKGEAFQPYKLIRTVVVGLVLGGLAQWKGVTLTVENWDAYIAANAGIIAAVDKLVTIVYRVLVPSEDDQVG